jgi:hypothetical protein
MKHIKDCTTPLKQSRGVLRIMAPRRHAIGPDWQRQCEESLERTARHSPLKTCAMTVDCNFSDNREKKGRLRIDVISGNDETCSTPSFS